MADEWPGTIVETGQPPPVMTPAPAGNSGISVRFSGEGAGPPASGAASREGTVAFWVSKGAPEHVAEGIADRVAKESGFNPTIPGDSGTSVGMYQHHAERKDRLLAQPNWQDP